MEHSLKRRKGFKLGPETRRWGTVRLASNKDYEFTGKVSSLKIERLESIGWPDPFPAQLPELKPKTTEDK